MQSHHAYKGCLQTQMIIACQKCKHSIQRMQTHLPSKRVQTQIHCTPRVQTHHAHQGCKHITHTKRLQTHHAHEGCKHITHTKGANTSCTPRVQTHHAHQGCKHITHTKRVQTHHAYKGCNVNLSELIQKGQVNCGGNYIQNTSP